LQRRFQETAKQLVFGPILPLIQGNALNVGRGNEITTFLPDVSATPRDETTMLSFTSQFLCFQAVAIIYYLIRRAFNLNKMAYCNQAFTEKIRPADAECPYFDLQIIS